MGFINLGDILRDRARKQGVSKQVEAAMVLEYFKQVVGEIFDKEETDAMNPMYVKDSILFIAVITPIIAQELKLREKQILKKINEKAGLKVIKSIRFLA